MTAMITAIVPAAGIGSRMQADRPKQYLSLLGKSVLEHTVDKLLRHPNIDQVVIAVSAEDPYYAQLSLTQHPRVTSVVGGGERADSVLSALDYVHHHMHSEWVMVHDAARPCVQLSDITRLIETAISHEVGGILATPVRDTMKRSGPNNTIDHTVERLALWHALTPQMFRCDALFTILSDALQQGVTLTDEASAFEWRGAQPALVAGRSDNIKITQPEDLALAEFYLRRNKEST
ncbi:2-C-methyl-D-erythritol 4-phosphate cytidylyltransferase [Vibrio palustris]|uniref:2-C-methyl-D-erythritol 4-phosphate cytidylyltransferase n=1 Tax=Vibrio palustris TaxID=1918946 RepID=A0A1R4B7V9_9VIBR|nr:2-C-methyl-D-erythritol 4-phosphate cytidylyltransferase [Vibrio palustris]SJL85008.1 2-C-methyl-D-erythritol 4-phosphate cytidylyltransferase [Vibrio palustris]